MELLVSRERTPQAAAVAPLSATVAPLSVTLSIDEREGLGLWVRAEQSMPQQAEAVQRA